MNHTPTLSLLTAGLLAGGSLLVGGISPASAYTVNETGWCVAHKSGMSFSATSKWQRVINEDTNKVTSRHKGTTIKINRGYTVKMKSIVPNTRNATARVTVVAVNTKTQATVSASCLTRIGYG